MATLAAISIAGGGLLMAVTGSTQAQAAAGVEDDGADCAVSLPGSTTSNSKLPDPFTRLNGTRITAKSDWRCRREEMKQLLEKYVYGSKAGKPTVSGTVSSTNITVNVSANGKSASFSASVSLPSGTGPFPAVVTYGGIADTTTIKNAGAAIINYDPYQLGKEGTARNNKQGAYYTLYGSNSSTGLLQAWGWGVSRIIDVIEQSGGNVLRADGVGITGCSRFGKGAIVGGAFDQRIALTMPIESGTAGVPILRGVNAEGAQSLSNAYSEQPWFGDAFSSYTGNPNALPVDTHELLALVAPRGLFVMDNPHIVNLGPKSASVAAQGAQEVYRALGATDSITYWSDVQDGTHCATRPEWSAPLTANIKRFLLKASATTGGMHISSSANGSLAQWRDWSTPTLTDNGSTTTTTTTTPAVTTTTTTTTPTVTTTTTTTTPTVTTTTSTSQQGGSCTATASTNAWAGGYVQQVTVKAPGNTTGWRVTIGIPAGAAITNSWNATFNGSSGTVTATNLSYNGNAGGGGAQFGFQGTGSPTGMTFSCTAS